MEPTEQRPLVLLVDDNADTRQLHALYLGQEGCETVEASNGFEAFDKALKRHPDVIVMDLRMPKLDGWETIRLLKNRGQTKEIPVVALTGDDNIEHLKLARNAGYEVFISTHYADPDKERRVLDTFRSRQVDGTLVISSTLGEAYPSFQEEWGMPIVLISPLCASAHRYQVSSDDIGGARTATLYLAGLGHRRIGHIGAPGWSRPGTDRRNAVIVCRYAPPNPWPRPLPPVTDGADDVASTGTAFTSMPVAYDFKPARTSAISVVLDGKFTSTLPKIPCSRWFNSGESGNARASNR